MKYIKVAQLWRLKGIKRVKTTLNPPVNSSQNMQIVWFVLVSHIGYEHRAVRVALMLAPLEKKKKKDRHTNSTMKREENI